jgi:hypothetical protein
MAGRQGAFGLSLLGGLAAALGVGWLGTQAPAHARTPIEAPGRDAGTVPLPAGLPAPVERYYRVTCGNQAPRADTFVLWGTARLKFGPRLSARFCVYHNAGRDFVRNIDLTWFNIPYTTVHDEFVNGKGATIMPGGQPLTGQEIDQGANHILWTEGVFAPSLLISDARIRWEAVDVNAARLDVPFGKERDKVTFAFDPQTGLLDHVRTQRFKKVGLQREPWRVDLRDWRPFPNGALLPHQISIRWENEPSPWSVWQVEGVAWNVDTAQHIKA